MAGSLQAEDEAQMKRELEEKLATGLQFGRACDPGGSEASGFQGRVRRITSEGLVTIDALTKACLAQVPIRGYPAELQNDLGLVAVFCTMNW